MALMLKKFVKTYLVAITTVLMSYANSVHADVKIEPVSQFEQQVGSLKGQVIYVDFWASWCGPCRQSFPWLNTMQSSLNKQGFTVLSVNVDAQQSFAEKFLAEFPASFPVIYDPKGKLARKFKVAGMPSSFIINREGNIVSKHVGFNADKQQAFEQEIKALLLK